MGNDLKVTLSLVDDFTQKLTGVQTQMGAFGKQLDYINNVASKFGLGIGIGIGATAISGQIKDLIEAGKQWNQVENQLKESLGYTSIALNEQAATLSNKYKIDEKEILTVQQRLSLYTQNEDAIKKLTPAIIDYASATGKTLLEATQLVTRAIETEKGSIKGFAGHLDGAAESSERLASITEILNKHFHGQAEAVEDSKNWFDKLTFSINQTKQAMGTALFGNQNAREMQEMQERKAFIKKYEEELSDSQREEFKDNYETQLKIVEEYEKKIGDEKTKAQKQQMEDAAEAAAKKMNLTPGFASEKDYTKDAKEKARKAAEEAKKKAEEDARLMLEGLNEYRSIQQKITNEQINENDKKKKDNIKFLADREKMFDEANKSQLVADEVYYKQIEIMIEDAKKEKLSEQNMAVNLAQQSTQTMETVAQASKANAQVQKRIRESGALIDGGAAVMGAWRSAMELGYPANIIAGVAMSALLTAETAAQVALIEQQQFAVGTPYAPGGPAIINERGGETAVLPRGTQVLTAGQTKAMGGGAGGEVHIHIHDANGNVLEAATQQLRSRQTADRFVSMVFSHANKMGIN